MEIIEKKVYEFSVEVQGIKFNFSIPADNQSDAKSKFLAILDEVIIKLNQS